MSSNSLEEEYPQKMIFLKESIKEQILMSDEQEVHCFYSSQNREDGKPIIIFAQGAGPGVYSWTDLWDELYKDYDLVIVDSREKPSAVLNKNSKCTVKRVALDIVETIHYLKIKEEDVIFIGSSFGAFYVAHCLAQNWVKPRSCVLIGPNVQPNYPKIKTRIAFMLPTFLLEKFGKRLARNYMKNKAVEGFQKKVYLDRVNSIDVKRWKRCKKMRWWDGSEDYKKIDSSVTIFSSSDDRYHKVEGIKAVNNLIKGSKLINLPSYNSMHIYPGVIEFSKMIKNLIETN